ATAAFASAFVSGAAKADDARAVATALARTTELRVDFIDILAPRVELPHAPYLGAWSPIRSDDPLGYMFPATRFRDRARRKCGAESRRRILREACSATLCGLGVPIRRKRSAGSARAAARMRV